MLIGGRRFKPALWSLALTLAGMSLFIALGFWQLQRAALKEDIENRFEQRLAEPYRALGSLADSADVEYRRLVLQGSYDSEHSLFVDNQLHRGRAGYHVLTPLRLRDSDDVVLVNRGWAPWGGSREVTPAVAEPVSVDGVAGIAYFPSEPALQMGDATADGGWPRLIPYVDIDALQPLYQGRLLPWVLWLAPEYPGEYVRDWNPVWMRPEKSRAYATQWFAFALLALVLFVILNLRKTE
jgi:surfeit locus 1 family protein